MITKMCVQHIGLIQGQIMAYGDNFQEFTLVNLFMQITIIILTFCLFANVLVKRVSHLILLLSSQFHMWSLSASPLFSETGAVFACSASSSLLGCFDIMSSFSSPCPGPSSVSDPVQEPESKSVSESQRRSGMGALFLFPPLPLY